jgi:hypothetical protein
VLYSFCRREGRIAIGLVMLPSPENSGRTSPDYKMQDQGNHGEEKKEVNQASSDVEHRESSDPRYQQHNKQNCPDAHLVSLSP